MLIRFSTSNYRSFKSKAVFSMVASKVTRHPDHVRELGDVRVLKSSFMFGANAGGKTNFVRAMNFARRIILGGIDSVSCDRRYFRLANERDDTGVFQFDLYTEGHFYSYGFAVSYAKASFVSEWLYRIDPGRKDVCLFSRVMEDGKNPVLDFDFELTAEEKSRFDVYAADSLSAGMRQTLFLVDIAKRSWDNLPIAREFATVRDWFERLVIIFPWMQCPGSEVATGQDRKVNELEGLLRHFDTGVDALAKVDVDYEDFLSKLSKRDMDEFKQSVLQKFSHDAGIRSVAFHMLQNRYVLDRDDFGDMHLRRVVSDHGNANDLFERNDESDGTKRLFDLLPLSRVFRGDAVVVIDELDRSLHTHATTEFVHMFFERSKGAGAQLIATTHDAEILDLNLLRQDEIWFVERDNDHSTQIYPLTKFKARFDKDVKKDYLLGRYGALPIFKSFDALEGV